MINLIYRKKTPQFNSIENVFNTLLPYLNVAKKIELPYSSEGIVNKIKNLKFILKLRNSPVNHITGHDHYLTLGCSKENTILTIHDIEFINRAKGVKKYILKKLWIDIPISKSRVVTTISEFSKQEIEALGNYKTSIKVIHNPLTLPINPVFKEFNYNHPKILHIGTKKNKNLDRLIKALRGINCLLIIVGKVDEKTKLLLSDNDIEYTEKFGLSNESIIDEYKNCDILSFVSTYEGFGLPLIEAQAMGRAVLSSNITSIPEISNGSALLVDPFNIEEIRDGILTLINNKEIRDNLVELGFKNIKRFQPEFIAKEYQKVYNIIR